MGEKKHIKADFASKGYQFTTDMGGVHPFGTHSGPYDYLLGALAGCLFYTFEELAEKMRFTYEHVGIEVDGTKRDAIPTTLEQVTLRVEARGVDNQQKFLKAFETATRYCSIYQTISQVSQMSWSVEFR